MTSHMSNTHTHTHTHRHIYTHLFIGLQIGPTCYMLSGCGSLLPVSWSSRAHRLSPLVPSLGLHSLCTLARLALNCPEETVNSALNTYHSRLRAGQMHTLLSKRKLLVVPYQLVHQLKILIVTLKIIKSRATRS